MYNRSIQETTLSACQASEMRIHVRVREGPPERFAWLTTWGACMLQDVVCMQEDAPRQCMVRTLVRTRY
jgi:hypothetical protein